MSVKEEEAAKIAVLAAGIARRRLATLKWLDKHKFEDAEQLTDAVDADMCTWRRLARSAGHAAGWSEDQVKATLRAAASADLGPLPDSLKKVVAERARDAKAARKIASTVSKLFKGGAWAHLREEAKWAADPVMPYIGNFDD